MALTPEQLAIRKVGGSDVATILGLNPFKSELELYHEKRETIEPIDFSDNLPVEAGNVLEAGIAELAASHMARRWNKPVKLRRCNRTLVHPKYNWLTVHIDRDVVGEARGVEIKNVGARMWRGWGEQGTDQIPDYYLPQPHTYMLVLDYPVWTEAVYFGGADMRLYEIERSREWDTIIVERTHTFWFDHVLKGIPPPFDPHSARALDVVKRLYPGTDGTTLVSTSTELMAMATAREVAKRKLNEAKMLYKGSTAALLDAMGNAAVLDLPNGTYTRKRVTRKEHVVEESSYIDFRLKGGKNEGEDE